MVALERASGFLAHSLRDAWSSHPLNSFRKVPSPFANKLLPSLNPASAAEIEVNVKTLDPSVMTCASVVKFKACCAQQGFSPRRLVGLAVQL